MTDKRGWPVELNYIVNTRHTQLKKVNNDQRSTPKNPVAEQIQKNSIKKTQDEKIEEENVYDNRYEVLKKKDYIEKWLMTTNRKVGDGTNSPSPSGSSTHSFILPTPPEKRTPRSPLIQIHQVKRQRTGKLKSRTLFKNNNEEQHANNNERKIGKKKDLFTEKENNLSLDLFSNENSDDKTSSTNENNKLSNSSPDSRLAACRAAFMMKKINKISGQKFENSRKNNNNNKFDSKNNNCFRIISETDSPVSSSNQDDKISDSSSSPRHVMSGIESVESSPVCLDDKIETASSDEDNNTSAIFIESDSEASITNEVIEDFSPLKVAKNLSLKIQKNIELKRNKKTLENVVNSRLKLPKKKLIDNFKKLKSEFIEEPEEIIEEEEEDDLNDVDKTLCNIENSDDELSQKNCKININNNKLDDDRISDPDENEESSLNEKTICESIDHSDDSDDDLPPPKACKKIVKRRESDEIIEDFGEEDQQSDKKIEENYSQTDSDKTYWSEPEHHQQENEHEELLASQKISQYQEREHEESSQKISQVSPSVTSLNLNGSVSDDRNISFNTSSSRPSDLGINPMIAPVLKKKKKPKKGTLVERLQNLVTSQASFLRIWRHQMGQGKYRGTTTQCIMIKIKKITQTYGRQIVYGPVINDAHNLLDNMIRKIDPTSSLNSDNPRDSTKNNITVITVPEIVGTIKIEGKSILRIYPPWEVYNPDDLVISCLYFNIIPDKSQANAQEDNEENFDEDNRVVESFDCPCIKGKKLANSCNDKFTNIKPNVIQYLFDH